MTEPPNDIILKALRKVGRRTPIYQIPKGSWTIFGQVDEVVPISENTLVYFIGGLKFLYPQEGSMKILRGQARSSHDG